MSWFLGLLRRSLGFVTSSEQFRVDLAEGKVQFSFFVGGRVFAILFAESRSQECAMGQIDILLAINYSQISRHQKFLPSTSASPALRSSSSGKGNDTVLPISPASAPLFDQVAAFPISTDSPTPIPPR